VARQVVVSPQAEAQIRSIDAWWRRNLLPTTRNHVYYLVGIEVVIVLAVWGSVKGSGPDLKGIE